MEEVSRQRNAVVQVRSVVAAGCFSSGCTVRTENKELGGRRGKLVLGEERKSHEFNVTDKPLMVRN